MREHPSRRRFLGTLAATGIAGGIAGCSGGSDQGSSPTETASADGASTEEPTSGESTDQETATPTGSRTVEDMVGRTVEVPTQIERTIGLGSGGLRMLAYMGVVDTVVGVEQLETTNEKRPYRPYVHAYPELTEKPSIGSRKSPDPELLLQQDPDVIVLGWGKRGKASDLQDRLGIPVVVVKPGDVDPNNRGLFFDSLDLLGTVLGKSDRASELRSFMEQTFTDLGERTDDVPAADRPDSYVGYLGRGKHGFPYTQPLYPPFDFVNADNVAGDVSEDLKKKKGAARVTVDPEQIIEWDPSYIFVDVGTETYEALDKPEYEGIEAIENGDIYTVFPTRDYSINFGTALADSYYVGSVLYPDRFSDVDPATKADDIYETFLGDRVYEDVADSYGTGFGKMEL